MEITKEQKDCKVIVVKTNVITKNVSFKVIDTSRKEKECDDIDTAIKFYNNL